MINAFHSNWTKPSLLSAASAEYKIEDFEILTTILSALKWREKNGNIKMVTDEKGAEFYKKINISSIWNLGIDATLDKHIDKDIDPKIFWAASKIYSLKMINTPTVMIDTDFIVWDKIYDKLEKKDFYCVHREELTKDIYPSIEHFNTKEGYEFNPKWDLEISPCNTAFLYLNNQKFKTYYVNSSINFMRNTISNGDTISNMVFAEQRLISMCAKYMNIKIHSLEDLENLFSKKQKTYTHIWGYKNYLRNNKKERTDFCIKCTRRILIDFPEFEDILANIKPIEKYYKIVKSVI